MRSSRPWLIGCGAIVLLCIGVYVYGVLTMPDLRPPEFPEPDDNAWHYMMAAARTMSETGATDTYKAVREAEDSGLEPDYAKAVAAYQPALEVLRQGLYNDCRVPGPTPDSAAESAQWAGIRELARALRIEAKAHACEGKPDEALASVRDCLRLGRNMESNAGLMDSFIGIAVRSMAAKALDDVLNTSNPSPQKLIEFVEWNEQNRHYPQSMADTILIDADVGMKRLAHTLGTGGPSMETVPSLILLRVIWSAQRRHLVRVIPWAKRPAFERGPCPKIRWNISDLSDIYARYAEKRDSDTAAMAGLSIRCALEAYHARAGTYPVSLAELVPDYIARLPADPFSGTDFRYQLRKGERSYLLYSIGPDLDDDRGAIVWDDSDGDLLIGPEYKTFARTKQASGSSPPPP